MSTLTTLRLQLHLIIHPLAEAMELVPECVDSITTQDLFKSQDLIVSIPRQLSWQAPCRVAGYSTQNGKGNSLPEYNYNKRNVVVQCGLWKHWRPCDSSLTYKRLQKVGYATARSFNIIVNVGNHFSPRGLYDPIIRLCGKVPCIHSLRLCLARDQTFSQGK